PYSNPMNAIFTRIEDLVVGSDGLQWLELLYRLQRGLSEQVDSRTADELIELGISQPDSVGVTLTAFGNKCADSAREYLLWIERGRRIHGEDQYHATKLENFRQKDVLELGPGWGSNLVRLAAVSRRVVGVEIEPVYLEFSRILPKREGISPPEIFLGRG